MMVKMGKLKIDMVEVEKISLSRRLSIRLIILYGHAKSSSVIKVSLAIVSYTVLSDDKLSLDDVILIVLAVAGTTIVNVAIKKIKNIEINIFVNVFITAKIV